jgi:BirA family transcriptional regulator, biotin operon repressor / biotin---[acetyl-CoA-carboxylase] ligase
MYGVFNKRSKCIRSRAFLLRYNYAFHATGDFPKPLLLSFDMTFRNATVIELDHVDSTNNYAANLLRLSSPPEGTVITARFQTQGKGQRGNEWQSEVGSNVLMSLVCYPSRLPAHDHFYLTKLTALAVAEWVEDHVHREVYIKWPNDIIVADKKIAGILIESQTNGTFLSAAILGIGLNVNQTGFDGLNATSLAVMHPAKWQVGEVVSGLQNYIEKYYLKLVSGQFSFIDQEYRARLYKLGQTALYSTQAGSFSATLIGVDPSGKMILRREDGAEARFDLKEIAMIYGC